MKSSEHPQTPRSLYALFFLLPFGCGDGAEEPAPLDGVLDFMDGLLQEPVYGPDPTNRLSGLPAAIALGEELFHDQGLSGNGENACQSCHDPALAFTDGLIQSEGQGGALTPRASMMLYGTGAQRWLNWDGSCDTAWCQAIGPMEKPGELGGDRVSLVHHLRDRYADDYASLGEGGLPDVSGWPSSAKPVPEEPRSPLGLAWDGLSPAQQAEATHVLVLAAKSISAYLETLEPPEAPFDLVVDRYREVGAEALEELPAEAMEGLRLFTGDGACSSCHFGPLLSNGEFHNIGLGYREWIDDGDMGRYQGIVSLRENPFNAAGSHSDAPGGEKGRRVAQLAHGMEQLGQYKTPSLRELLHTAPYMHAGHFGDLDEVIGFYSELDEAPLHGHREEMLEPLGWSETDIAAVRAFLELFSSVP